MMRPTQSPMAPVCSQCQTVFQEPKVLPCLHTFCSNCLGSLASEGNSSELTCPTCGCFITLPPSGVDGLKTNAFVKRLADLYFEEIKTLRKAPGSVEPDEGFADQAEVVASSIPRSETWHGPHVMREMPSMVQSKSVNGDVPLSTYTSLTPQEPAPEHPPQEHPPNSEEDQARVQVKKTACSVVGKLTTKLMNLQGEALRLTYAIDTVNESVNHWKERNNEIKAKIQDRSVVLQHLIKTHEQKLLNEVDNMENHEQFLNEADRAKSDLRANLKRVLNAVQFLKQIQNFANDDEVLEMKDFLLGDLKILTSVETDQKEYTLALPSPTQVENLSANFGNLESVQKKTVVFEPEDGNSEGSGGMKLTQLEKVKQMEFTNASSSKMRRKRRAKTQQIRFSSQDRKPSPSRRATRIITSEERDGLSSPEKLSPEKEDPVGMSNLQETLKQRRRDFIEERKVEDNLVNVHDVQLLSVHRRPTRDKKRRVQSFGGRASSRTRQMEQAVKELQTVNGEQKQSASFDKADSFDSVDGDDENSASVDGKPQASDDKATKLKYLRENWWRRREILRSSESSRDQGSGDTSPTSPKSPNSPTAKAADSKFSALRDQYTFIRSHFSSNNTQTSQTTIPKATTFPPNTPNMNVVQTAGATSQNPVQPTPAQSQSPVDRPLPSRRMSSAEVGREAQSAPTTQNDEEEHVFIHPSSDQATGGLTRTKLMQLRDNARKKKERWRSLTLS